MSQQSRFELGMAQLKAIDGEAGESVYLRLFEIYPALADLMIEFPFGSVYSRDELDLKSREIATVAALTAMGSCLAQLKVHIQAALNVGCSMIEINEVILQMSVYAGFPAALNGLFCAQEVYQEKGLLE
ncbi:MAG: hypothetical protein CENE_01763 [Candidatus Celerinatantimonas neptuna]|nr:MAG: hypothetical protein CENE_01763 [Candidatus Celerinatantimonas neptuna]